MNTIHNAIQRVQDRHPWLGRVANRLEKVYTDTFPDGSANKTMATNGKQLFINPAFAESLPAGELAAVIAHEVTHVIQRHPLRRGDRDPQVYNEACDHAVNHIVGKQLYYTLPDTALHPINDSAENIYNQLVKTQPKDSDDSDNANDDSDNADSQGGGSSQSNGENESNSESDSGSNQESSDSGAPSESSSQPSDNSSQGDVLDYPLAPGQTMQDAERELDQLLAEASLDMELSGEKPGVAEGYAFEHIFKPVETGLNWIKELEEYVNLIGGSDYSMNPPHTGLAQQGIICNQLNPSGCGNVVLAVDVSGSIDRDKLNLALTHLLLFVENIDYESLRVIACNRRVTYDETFYRGETPDVSAMSVGGGTAFTPLFDRVAEGAAPDLLIYFSDMHVYNYDAPEDDPGYPVIWLVDSNRLDEAGDWRERGGWSADRFFAPDWGSRINAQQ